MRCSCMKCGSYMAQSDDSHLGCVCPQCGNRCKSCLGTDTVMDKDAILALKEDTILASMLLKRFADDEDE